MEFRLMMTVRKEIEVHRHLPFKVLKEEVCNRMDLQGREAENWKDYIADYIVNFADPINPEAELLKFQREVELMPLADLKPTNPNLSSLNHCNHSDFTSDWDVKEVGAGQERTKKKVTNPQAESHYIS